MWKKYFRHKFSFFNGFAQTPHPLNSQNLLSMTIVFCLCFLTIRALFRTQISKMNYFFKKRLNSFQQKAPSQIFERFWIYLWHGSLEYCHFKTSNLFPPPPWKMKKCIYCIFDITLYILCIPNIQNNSNNRK